MPGRYSDELRRITREKSGRQEAAASSEQPKPSARWRYGPLVAFAFVLTLVGVGWMLVQQMTADSKLQDCVMSGRKNCVAPVESAGR